MVVLLCDYFYVEYVCGVDGMRCEYDLNKQVNPRVKVIKDHKEYGFKLGMEVFIKGSSYVDKNLNWFCDFGAMNEYFQL